MVPDLPLLLRLMARMMRARTYDMVAADKANQAELADDAPVRERRERCAETRS